MYVGMYERANIILYNLRECLHTNIRSSYCLLFECSAAAAMATGKHQQLLTLIVQCFRWMVAVEIPYNSGDAKWASGGNYFTCCCHKPSTNIRCQPLTLLRKCSATDTSCTNGCTSLRSFWCDGWRVTGGVWRVAGGVVSFSVVFSYLPFGLFLQLQCFGFSFVFGASLPVDNCSF